MQEVVQIDARPSTDGAIAAATERAPTAELLAAFGAEEVSAAVLRAATEHSIVATDAQGVIRVFSAGAEQMLGYQAAEIIGAATPILFHDPDEVAARAAELGLPVGFDVFIGAARRDRPETRDWMYVRKDATRLPVSLTVTPIHAPDGAIAGYLGLARDVTARKQAEAAQAASERLKDEFLANVSHDLRTPLAAIKASIGVVLANEPCDTSAPLHRLLVNIDQAAERMTSLVDDLLELTRLRAGRVAFEPHRRDLREVVTRAAAGIEPLARTRGQHVTVRLPRTPVRALVDEPRLERALLNLLGNAHKYGREGGAISVSLDRRYGEAVLSVADDGPGIPVAEHERVFQRFYRCEPAGQGTQGSGQASRHASVAGSGLGLAIARAMVDLHRGRLWVESQAGQGATFRIAIPVHPARHRAHPARRAEQPQPTPTARAATTESARPQEHAA